MLAFLVKPDDEKPKGAYQCNVKDLRFPYYASWKIDGIRGMVNKGILRSRKNLAIPNSWIRHSLAHLPNGPDGELVTFTGDKMDDFHTVQSKVMSEDGAPDFKFMLFDFCQDGYEWMEFEERLQLLKQKFTTGMRLDIIPQILVSNHIELENFEEDALVRGYEGVCIKSPTGSYKTSGKDNRSTPKENYLGKLKRFTEGEAICTGVEPLWHNENEATTDETGHAKRSTHMDGLVVDHTMVGALICVDVATNAQFKIGSGFTEAQRRELMLNKPINKLITYKHQKYGAKQGGKPRIPIFRGVRLDIDPLGL